VHRPHKTWKDIGDLLRAISDRARCGGNVVLLPSTALWLVQEIEKGARLQRISTLPSPDCRHDVDMYQRGSRILEIDGSGNIVDVVAWASNGIAARQAFDYLCEFEPGKSFEQRRRGWVESDRIMTVTPAMSPRSDEP
jgi:hypothetical protein